MRPEIVHCAAAVCVLYFFAAIVARSHGEVQTRTIEYTQGDAQLKGFLAFDDATATRRPGVLIVHEWWGLNDHARNKAKALAEAGYLAFAIDMYGEGKATEHPEQAREWAGYCRHHSDVATARFEAAYAWLNAHELLEPGRMAAIGYCFGGNVVFSKALEGVALDAVVSFHGSLPQDAVAQGTKVTARILVCNGGDDGLISDEQIATFQQNVRDAGADWQFISYGGARHSFTNPDADKHGMAAIGYNAKADKRSWAAMLSLFAEIC